MAKRDQILAFLLQLPKWLAVLAIIIGSLIIWGLLFRWSSLPLVLRACLALVFAVLFLRQLVKQVRQANRWEQWRHVEYLRMHHQQAPLSVFQPEADLNRLTLPMVMVTRLSALVYVGFTIFWMGLFGVVQIALKLPREAAGIGGGSSAVPLGQS